ncbi:excinuclease ABC subunit UvrA [Methanococcoides methylutens]|nr:excinuclease ABC subunit UvrA [Methanococcoides methylutens]
MDQFIEIKGAKEHNLKNVSAKIPKNKLVVLAGPSGSGKSTFAMDILQRECQRQYMESMGLVTDGMSKPKVDDIIGLSPSIAISQRLTNRNPRSTVGTSTEILTYLRVLYAKLGERPCPNCGHIVKPVFQDDSDFEDEIEDLDDQHSDEDFQDGEFVECNNCHTKLPKLKMASFSFNKPDGFCPTCSGLGVVSTIDLTPILDKNLSIKEGAVKLWGDTFGEHYSKVFETAGKHYRIELDASKPVKDFNEIERLVFYHGVESEEFKKLYPDKKTPKRVMDGKFEGVITFMKKKSADNIQKGISNKKIGACFKMQECSDCKGTRLRKESREVTLNNRSIVELSDYTIKELLEWTESIPENLSEDSLIIAKPVLFDIRKRILGLVNIGLDYLTIGRAMTTLSGGEGQRLRLASLLDSGLTGVLYVLDEPTTGLHPKDVDKLIHSLKKLRDLGNTVLVIEHDLDFIKKADHVIDFGPESGIEGGQIIAEGTPEEISENPNSVTGKYLTTKNRVVNENKLLSKDKISIINAYEHNLKNVNIDVPIKELVCFTGVSGSGKSTLVFDVLRNWTMQEKVKCEKIVGLEKVQRIITVDQKPIGRASRSNVATYTDIFTQIRTLFSGLDDAKKRNLSKKHFSFNIKGGRCEKCFGLGVINLDMQFLPDTDVPCPVCHGKRFKKDVLQVKYKGYSISDILNLSIDENIEIFKSKPAIHNKLMTLKQVGLGYLELGQSTSTLSGGECQRIKLSKELGKTSDKNTLFLLDEPTSGLHPRDIDKLIRLLKRIVREGNTVLIIEHSLEMVSNADWIIDLGPHGGSDGGKIIFEGTPMEIMECESSHTGKYLKSFLN